MSQTALILAKHRGNDGCRAARMHSCGLKVPSMHRSSDNCFQGHWLMARSCYCATRKNVLAALRTFWQHLPNPTQTTAMVYSPVCEMVSEHETRKVDAPEAWTGAVCDHSPQACRSILPIDPTPQPCVCHTLLSTCSLHVSYMQLTYIPALSTDRSARHVAAMIFEHTDSCQGTAATEPRYFVLAAVGIVLYTGGRRCR